MREKYLSWILSLLLLINLAIPVMAEETEIPEERHLRIVNLKNLEALAENCRLDRYSENLVISLETDLDLEGRDFDGIPIFSGKFQGNGHTISGLHLTQEGSSQGFFRYLTESAVVTDLHLQGIVQPAGSAGSVGGFAGENHGVIRGCSFDGTVSGKEYVGGITGINSVTGMIENCRVSGTVYGGHFVGGIAGKNAGTVRACENNAPVNETSQQNQVELSDITLDSVIHSEAANTVTDVGGIAGRSTGMIRSCVNRASVGYPSMGYNIGGIAGTQSGTILDCSNQADVYGRKEVGGIAGQMEPSSVMRFESDVFQILQKQMDDMGKIVGQASSNLTGSGQALTGQLGQMKNHLTGAVEALGTLMPNPETMEFPDADTVQAARNNIGSSMTGMYHTINGMSATAASAFGAVSTNLNAMNNQLNAMRQTIGNVSETLGGSILDLSDQDTEEDLSGKVADCENFGDIFADMNGGGIAGAIAMENDLDVQEDWIISGENSLNFESEVRAVILNCENSGIISVGKQNAGGIVGLQSLGLVKMGRNSGKLNAEKADYVGGISGRSTGFVRNSYANGELLGGNYVGGIAGSAAVATDCSALVRIVHGVERLGAVLGSTEENLSEVEDPIARNYYLAVQEDPGAVDGISYDGQAQPLTEEAFFLQDNLPDMFRHVKVTFRYENDAQRVFTVDFGTSFPKEWIPPIPPKEGRQAYWKGLKDADMSGIFFDMVFEQEYTNQTNVLESQIARNGIPLLFVQGVFSEDAALRVQEMEEQLPLDRGERLLEVWQFHTTEPANQTQIRIQLPEKADAETVRIRIRSADHSWREENCHILGRYAVASLASGDDAIAVVQTAEIPWLLMGLTFAGFSVLTGILLSRKRKMKKRWQ